LSRGTSATNEADLPLNRRFPHSRRGPSLIMASVAGMAAGSTWAIHAIRKRRAAAIASSPLPATAETHAPGAPQSFTLARNPLPSAGITSAFGDTMHFMRQASSRLSGIAAMIRARRAGHGWLEAWLRAAVASRTSSRPAATRR